MCHAVIECINKIAEQELAAMKSEEENDKKRKSERILSQQYLCTGYDLYTTKEPCVMYGFHTCHCRFNLKGVLWLYCIQGLKELCMVIRM